MITSLCALCGGKIYKSIVLLDTWCHRETTWQGHAAQPDPVRHSGERPRLMLVRGGLR